LVKPVLILITGMAGSGKTTFAQFFKEHGFKIITMGDVIRRLAEGRGMSLDSAALGKLAEEVRKKEGEGVVAEQCLKIIKKEQYSKVVVDGIRSLDEVDVFRRVHSAKLIAIHASPGTRFKRLLSRGRSDDANQEKIMIERDLRELGFGVGSAIAMADYMIVNEGSIHDLKKKFEELSECLPLG